MCSNNFTLFFFFIFFLSFFSLKCVWWHCIVKCGDVGCEWVRYSLRSLANDNHMLVPHFSIIICVWLVCLLSRTLNSTDTPITTTTMHKSQPLSIWHETTTSKINNGDGMQSVGKKWKWNKKHTSHNKRTNTKWKIGKTNGWRELIIFMRSIFH